MRSLAAVAALVGLGGLAACGWTQREPEPNPAHWQSCGPYCRRPAGPPQPDCLARGTAEFAGWVAPGIGTRLSPDRTAAIGLTAGVEATFPLAFDENLRVGPWADLGGDTLDVLRARGGLAVLVGDLPDPGFVPWLAGTHHEGALELRLGGGWRALSGLDDHSDGSLLAARLAFGSRRFTETNEGGNAYDVCTGASHTTTQYNNQPIDRGHWGPGWAFGHRVFIELERSLAAPTTQLIFGVEIDPATVIFAGHERNSFPI